MIFYHKFFNFFEATYILILKINIILFSGNKLHCYFKLAKVIFIVFNPKIMKNAKALYYDLGFIVKYISIFFSPIFKFHFDKLLKNITFKFFISILLKFIDSNMTIVFVTHNDF